MIILKNKHVTLRPLKLSDAPRFIRWLGDPEVATFLAIGDEPPSILKAEREWIAAARKGKDSLTLAIETSAGEHIGSIGLRKIHPKHKFAEYGIMIGNKKYWGQGLGTEAGWLLLNYAFKQLKLHRVYLYFIAYNERGMRSYKKLGFKFEGRNRKHYWRKGAWHDRMIMGMLREEWMKKQGKLEKRD